MDKWIRNIVDEYNEIIIENPYYIPNVAIRDLSKGFRRFVSDHLFYYEKITSKALGESDYNFILIHRSTPFRFDVDFYYGVLYIYVLVDSSRGKIFDQILIGKFLISDFLYGFVSGHDLYGIQSNDLDNELFDSDDDEIPF